MKIVQPNIGLGGRKDDEADLVVLAEDWGLFLLLILLGITRGLKTIDKSIATPYNTRALQVSGELDADRRKGLTPTKKPRNLVSA